MKTSTLCFLKKTSYVFIFFLFTITVGNANEKSTELHANSSSVDNNYGTYILENNALSKVDDFSSFLRAEFAVNPTFEFTRLRVSVKDFCHILCYGGNNAHATAEPKGGTAPYTYLWSNGATTQKLTGLTAGTYQITVTDANGETASCEVVINEPAKLDHSIVKLSDVSTTGASDGSAKVTASGGTKPYTYAWDNGETTATATALNAGKHSVTITDKNGCTTKCYIEIGEPEPEDCKVAGDNGELSICEGDAQPNEAALFAA